MKLLCSSAYIMRRKLCEFTVLFFRTEEAEGSGVNEGREVATGTVSHNITMQPNPVYNVMTSDSQEPEYDYIM